MNLNKVFIIGNLTRDPELRTLPSGRPVASFGVATNRTWKNEAGEQQQEVQYHNIVTFGRQAEIANQYLKKGSMVFIEGRIQTRNWEGQDGTKKFRTEIVTERLQLGPKKWSGANTSSSTTSENNNNKNEEESLETIEYPEENNDPEDIPF